MEHKQRVKNNAKPSSSGRSAEFLGNQKALFPTQLKKTLSTFETGLTDSDKLIEDYADNSMYMIIRKLNKKDPVTKKKALEELSQAINDADIDEVVKVLPLWSKMYGNLASDPTHNVRELTQVVQKNLAVRCNRNMAPFLKQLVPIWLFSHFDNYAPAASTARSSFVEVFNVKSNRIQEVCLYCQQPILERINENLAKSSLGSSDHNKIYEGLEVLCFFIEHTMTIRLSEESNLIIRSILQSKNFWRFGNEGAKHVRTAWFKVINYLLQNEGLNDALVEYKRKIIEISFNGIDESDKILSDAIWNVILRVQLKYDDWYTYLHYASIQSKLNRLFQNNFFNNFETICSKMLSFYTALISANFKELDNWHKPLEECLTNMKNVFCTADNMQHANENDYKAIIEAYFDCWNLFLNKFLDDDHYEKKGAQHLEQKLTHLLDIFHIIIIDPINRLLATKRPLAAKLYFSNTIKIIEKWKRERSQVAAEHKQMFYHKLLSDFWQSIHNLIGAKTTTSLMDDDNNAHFPEEIILLLQLLVRFNNSSDDGGGVSAAKQTLDLLEEERRTNEERLKNNILQLSRYCCIKNIANNECQLNCNCPKHIQSFIDIYPEAGFCKDITSSTDLSASIKFFVNFLDRIDKKFYLDIVDVIFKLLNFMDNNEKLEFVTNNLFCIQPMEVQILILERLLCNYSNSKQNKLLLSSTEATNLIRDVTKSVLKKGASGGLSSWLAKIFLKDDESGEFLVGAATVNAILQDICELTLQKQTTDKLKCLYIKLLHQIMPTPFSQAQINNETKIKMFITIFQILVESTVKNFLTENTFDDLTTCLLSVISIPEESAIATEATILHCGNFVKSMLLEQQFALPHLIKCADVINGLITAAAQKTCCADKASSSSIIVNKLVTNILNSSDITTLREQLNNYALSLEAINGMVSPIENVNYQILEQRELHTLLQSSLLNLYIIKCLNKMENMIEKHLTYDDFEALNSTMCNELLECVITLAAVENVEKIKNAESSVLTSWIQEFQKEIKPLINQECEFIENWNKTFRQKAMLPNIPCCRALSYLSYLPMFQVFEENANIIFTDEMLSYFLEQDTLATVAYFLQYQLPNLSARTLTSQKVFLCERSSRIWIQCATLRCLVENTFTCKESEKSDRHEISKLLKSVRVISEKMHAEKLMLYETAISECDTKSVADLMEYIRLLTSILTNIPWSIGAKEWGDITMGIFSWTTTILKSIEMYTNLTVALFITNVCRIFFTFMAFSKTERESSSTSVVRKAIEEWDTLYAKEVNCKIFQVFITLLQQQEKESTEYFLLLFNQIKHTAKHLDYDIVYSFSKASPSTSPESVFTLLLKNLSNANIAVQKTCSHMLHELACLYVKDDVQKLKITSSSFQSDGNRKHCLQLFEDFLTSYEPLIEKYNEEFSFKMSEIDEFGKVDTREAFGYLLMWDCMVHAWIQAPLFLRSIYTNWLCEGRFFEKFLHFLIRVMPIEVLKNHDTKFTTCEIFNDLTTEQINDDKLTHERYACHVYTKVLKKLPAVVRKWWNSLPSRQKVFVDKLTTNFVSPIITDEELKSIAASKERHENMQVTVHLSTREVLALYFIDEVRTELTLTLPANYPLGPVKVNCSKNIGGRLSSRNIDMQLALFLTHQNGTILDGLALWKSILDKKFEGIEECYVCYNVIHHDTCQLPKLTCKTCKKKFHGSCLYKWFTTSSKSTCPICRNVF